MNCATGGCRRRHSQFGGTEGKEDHEAVVEDQERNSSNAEGRSSTDHGQGSRVRCRTAIQSDSTAADVAHSRGSGTPSVGQSHRQNFVQARRLGAPLCPQGMVFFPSCVQE